MELLKDYKYSIEYMTYRVNYYLVEEYYVEENTYDENGEWVSGGDIWGFCGGLEEELERQRKY